MEGTKSKYVSHMVGIIPIQNGPANDGLPWPNALTPLYRNYTALHRSILECAIAGCSSIWVITEKKYIPLMKSVVGNFIQDPILSDLPVEYKANFSISIPIWYISIPVRDIGRRDCYARSILAGAEYSIRVASKLSDRFVPDKFYVSFPHSVYSAWSVQPHRKAIKSNNKNFYIAYEGKTIKDGTECGFTFFLDDYHRFRKDFKSKDIGTFAGDTYEELYKLPVDQRNTGSRLTLDEVFHSATLEGAVVHERKEVYNISTWEGYVKYMSSPRFYKMPKKVKYFHYNKIKNLEARLIDTGGTDAEDNFTETGS